jgi:DNA-binding transcriptional ArsR family regulator
MAENEVRLMSPKADLLFHPVRMRIILTLAHGDTMTAQQLGLVLPDVPQATLYRHLNKLLHGGVLGVVEERPARGAIERVYALTVRGATLSATELANASREDQMRYFTTFVGTLLGDYARYLRREHIDLLHDGVGYRQVPLYLSDAELMNMSAAINAAIVPLLANGPEPDRQRRVLTTILMPVDEVPDQPATR